MSMFRRRLLMQQAMSVPDPIATYDPTGHTNEDMAEYPVLTDLTGNGHDISCNNFAWSEMSGIGGYDVTNFTSGNLFTKLYKGDAYTLIGVPPYKGSSNAGVEGSSYWLYASVKEVAERSFKIKLNVSGIIEGNNLYIAQYNNNYYGETALVNGVNDIVMDLTQSTKNDYPYLYFYTDSAYTTDITIELLPLYGNALVSDGVDDYGICENFPILTKEKGYTVVAVRKWITQDNQGAVVSKNTVRQQTGAFLFEGKTTSNCFIGSFGNFKLVNNFTDSLFTYQTSTKYGSDVEFTLTSDKVDETNLLAIFSYYNNSYVNNCRCSIALYSLEIYDRDLTPYQIEAVKKRLMDKYNSPEDTTSDWYGVEWYTNQSPSRVMRIGNMNLHRTLPIQSGMYRCILNDNGEEVYKLDPNDSTKKEDGTAAVLDGTDGQVMVYIPVFYARFESKGYRRRVKLSDHYKPGFIRMGGCYVSAYEAAVDRTISTLVKLASVVNTTANFRGGNNNAEWDSTYRSLLGMPATAISLTNFRNYARNRKDGDTQWNCMDYTAYKAVYWLYVVEYADRNCQLDFNENLTSDGFRQGGLGAGVTNINSAKWNSFNGYRPFVPCGHTNSLGNKTGIVQFIMPFEYDAGGADNYAGAYDAGTPYTDGQFVSDGQELYECIANAAAGTALSDTTYFTNIPRTSTNVPSYRGIENIFGHIWKWTDGVHIKVQSEEAGGKSILYTSDNPDNYQDTNYDGYQEKGYVTRANGHVRDIIFGRDGDFYASEDGATGGSSTTYFSDYSYTNIPASEEALRGLLLSGSAYNGSDAGLVHVHSNNGPSASGTYFGSRLCYIPNN